MSTSHRHALTLCCTALLACPAQAPGAQETGESETGESETSCAPLDEPEPANFDVSQPLASPPINWRARCAEEDFTSLDAADAIGEEPLEFEISHPTQDGAWPPGEFPLLIFSHGNNLYWDNYAELVSSIVSAGYIVANIKSDTTSQSRTRGERILCVSRFIRAGDLPDGVMDHWNGQFVFAGQSTGGEGAVYAARRFTDYGDSESEAELIGVATIAPSLNIPGLANLSNESLRSFFAIAGSRDNDVNERLFGVYDAIQTEDPASEVPAKALVYAHSVAHRDWGGCNPADMSVCPTDKASALLGSYLIPYLRWVGRGDIDGRVPLAQTPFSVPQILENPAFWPASMGLPRVFRAFAVGTQTCASGRAVVDSFSNLLEGFSDVGTISYTGFDTVEENDANALVSSIVPSKHLTGVALLEWSQPGARVEWSIDAQTALAIEASDHLSLRMGQVVEPEAPDCALTLTSLDATLRLVDGEGQVAEQVLSSFDEIPVPEVLPRTIGAEDLCLWHSSMTSVRIPMSAFCTHNPLFDVTTVTKVELEFDQADAGAVLLDSLEFTWTTLDEAACTE